MRRILARVLPAVLLTGFLSAPASGADQDLKVVVPGIYAYPGIPEGTSQVLTDLLLEALLSRHGIRALGPSDVRAVLTAEQQKSLLACSDESCMAELAGALTGVIRDSLRGREKQRCWEHCVRSMKEAIKEAEDCGVIVSVEVLNRFEHFLLNTCDEALRFVDEVGSPNLKILLDTYHMNIEEDSLGQAIIKAGDRLGLLHVAESNRRPPGNGHIPWDEVIGALKQIDYQGDTVLEPIIVPGGVIGNVFAVWRDLTGGLSLDEAARRGLEFYKARLGSA